MGTLNLYESKSMNVKSILSAEVSTAEAYLVFHGSQVMGKITRHIGEELFVWNTIALPAKSGTAQTQEQAIKKIESVCFANYM